ncbi:D12 class N6 adenine-specific DNA methyltransferase [Mycobacteroides abscessus subsp. abscessus]|nr:D12 class N6 adenine-specific DNA methyltransferase [Mycobacteroides abscessus subsp. abscessus]
MRSVGAHQELAEACLRADAAVAVSGYASELWDGMLDGWYRYEIPMLTSQGSGDGRRTEIVWSNRPLEGLHEVAISSIDGARRPAARAGGRCGVMPRKSRSRTTRLQDEAAGQPATYQWSPMTERNSAMWT